MIYLSRNFTLDEFIETSHRSIDNSLPPHLVPNATRTCEMLQRIRDYLCRIKGSDVPVTMSSGYRCLALNQAVGGSKDSDHMRAAAADINARAYGDPYEVCRVLVPVIDELGIGQIINEFGRWVHVSTEYPKKPINRIITYVSAGDVRVGIVRV